MAVLEKVVIKIKGDSKELDPTIVKLQKLGQVDKKNAAQFNKSSKEFQKSTKKSKSLLKGLGKQSLVLGAALIGAFSIKKVVGNVINIIKDFEKEMSTLQSITGSTAKEMEFFKKAAVDIGRATKTSATEVVKAFTLIGSAQPELLKNQKALAAVTEQALILSKAAGIDAVSAADALTGAMNQFGASANDAAKFTDIFATSQQKGSSFIIDTSEALKLVGASADAVGLSFETTNAAIQALAKGALKGSMAGTSLNAVLAQLSKQNDDKINPSIVGLSKALEELEKRNLSFKDATELVQIEGAKGLLTLIKQRDIFEELNGNLNETGNAMEQMIINTDNLDGSLDEMGNAWEEFVLSLSGSGGILKGATDALTVLLRAITVGITPIETFKEKMTLLTLALGRQLTSSEKNVIAMAGINREQIKLIAGKRAELELLKKTKKERKELVKSLQEEKGGTKDLGDEEEKRGKTIGELRKELTELKKEQAALSESGVGLAGNLREIRDIEEKLKKVFDEATEAIAKQGFEFKKLKPIIEKLTLAKEKDMLVSDFFAKEEVRSLKELSDLQDERNAKAQLAIEAQQQLFEINALINESKLIAIENERQTEIQSLIEQRDSQRITEEQFIESKIKLEKKFNEERAKIQRRQAIADKVARIIEVVINTAAAIVKTIAVLGAPPSPAGIAGIIAAVALGATQASLIAAQPIPKFHKGKRGEYSGEEIPALIRKSEYVIPPGPSRKHRGELDAMLQNKFERFVFMKYQMPVIKQFSKTTGGTAYDDFDLKRNQRRQIGLLSENNELLREMLPSMKRASYGW